MQLHRHAVVLRLLPGLHSLPHPHPPKSSSHHRHCPAPAQQCRQHSQQLILSHTAGPLHLLPQLSPTWALWALPQASGAAPQLARRHASLPVACLLLAMRSSA